VRGSEGRGREKRVLFVIRKGKVRAYVTEECRKVRAELFCRNWLVVNDE
jgi:hypothetical protein